MRYDSQAVVSITSGMCDIVGRAERVHMHVEQFYIQDCHQNVTA